MNKDQKHHLHNYKNKKETNNFKLEICEICKKRLVLRKGRRGRVDHKAYYMEHLRSFLQRGSKLYAKYYGINKPYIKRNTVDDEA